MSILRDIMSVRGGRAVAISQAREAIWGRILPGSGHKCGGSLVSVAPFPSPPPRWAGSTGATGGGGAVWQGRIQVMPCRPPLSSAAPSTPASVFGRRRMPVGLRNVRGNISFHCCRAPGPDAVSPPRVRGGPGRVAAGIRPDEARPCRHLFPRRWRRESHAGGLIKGEMCHADAHP